MLCTRNILSTKAKKAIIIIHIQLPSITLQSFDDVYRCLSHLCVFVSIFVQLLLYGAFFLYGLYIKNQSVSRLIYLLLGCVC